MTGHQMARMTSEASETQLSTHEIDINETHDCMLSAGFSCSRYTHYQLSVTVVATHVTQYELSVFRTQKRSLSRHGFRTSQWVTGGFLSFLGGGSYRIRILMYFDVSCMYPDRILMCPVKIHQDTSRYNKIHLQIRTSLDTIEIHVSHYVSLMYPACILHVSSNLCR